MSRVCLDLTYIPPFSNRLREKLIHLMLIPSRDHRGCIHIILVLYCLYFTNSVQHCTLYHHFQKYLILTHGSAQDRDRLVCRGGRCYWGNNIWRYLGKISAPSIFRQQQQTIWDIWSGEGRCLYSCDIYLQYMCTS